MPTLFLNSSLFLGNTGHMGGDDVYRISYFPPEWETIDKVCGDL